MDEFENQARPWEPEDMEKVTAEEIPAVIEEEPAAPEEPAAQEIPVAEEKQEEPPVFQPPRRRSPYENSPYMMHHQPVRRVQPQSIQEEAPATRPAKRGGGCILRAVLWCLSGIAVGTILFFIFVFGSTWMQDETDLRIQALEAQIDAMEAQLDAYQNTGESVSGTPNVGIDGGMTPAQVYAQNQQSVVLIETDVATGSGFVLTEDGYVVTNYHVVEDGETIGVVLYDNSYLDAELIGYDANNDVALLKMEGSGFRAVTLGSSDALIVGDQVAAIGNPLGELTSTLTAGYVSAKERDVSTDNAVINMIQTDCAINSGNSGGPLFNMKGEVVGITTAKYSGLSASGASIEGIGFAIPMDDVVGILDDLMEFGYVKSGYLGVTVYTLTPADVKLTGGPQGCLVDSVSPGSCAETAGVLPGDIIIGLGGHDVDGYTDLSRALREFDGGETTTVTVWRDGQELILPITLDERPREDLSQPTEPAMPDEGSYEEWYNYFFGEGE